MEDDLINLDWTPIKNAISYAISEESLIQHLDMHRSAVLKLKRTGYFTSCDLPNLTTVKFGLTPGVSWDKQPDKETVLRLLKTIENYVHSEDFEGILKLEFTSFCSQNDKCIVYDSFKLNDMQIMNKLSELYN